jgi:hypothetical protein
MLYEHLVPPGAASAHRQLAARLEQDLSEPLRGESAALVVLTTRRLATSRPSCVNGSPRLRLRRGRSRSSSSRRRRISRPPCGHAFRSRASGRARRPPGESAGGTALVLPREPDLGGVSTLGGDGRVDKAVRERICTLARAGRYREAQEEFDKFVRRGGEGGTVEQVEAFCRQRQ